MNLSNFTETPFCRVVARFLILTMLCYGLPVQAAVPIADAGSNQVIEKTELSGGRTMLDGGASFDPDGDPLSFQWFGPFFRLFDLAPQAVVPEGLSTVALQVDDGSATSSADTATVEVVPCFSINTRPKPGKVQLTWSPQADAQRYDIYRSTEAAPVNFVKIGETTSDYSTYLDTPVDNEATYLYQVNAVTVTGTCFSGVDSTHPTTSRRRGLNYAPVIYSTPVARASENIVYGSDINATDPNDDTLTYHLTQSPADMTIDQVNGLIHWIPAVTGTFPVTVQV